MSKPTPAILMVGNTRVGEICEYPLPQRVVWCNTKNVRFMYDTARPGTTRVYEFVAVHRVGGPGRGVVVYRCEELEELARA